MEKTENVLTRLIALFPSKNLRNMDTANRSMEVAHLAGCAWQLLSRSCYRKKTRAEGYLAEAALALCEWAALTKTEFTAIYPGDGYSDKPVFSEFCITVSQLVLSAYAAEERGDDIDTFIRLPLQWINAWFDDYGLDLESTITNMLKARMQI